MNIIEKLYYYLRITGKNIIPAKNNLIDFYHLIIVLKGNFTYIINGKEIKMSANDALLLSPGTERKRLPHPESADYILMNFQINNKYAVDSFIHFKNGITPSMRNLLNSYPFRYYNNISYSHKFYKHPAYSTDDLHSELMTGVILHNIFNCILIELLNSANYTKNNIHVNRIIRYVNDNVTAPISLTDISKAIHLSKEYTSKVFKKEMNMTVTDYIISKKLSLAKAMLISGDMGVGDIAEKLGYQDYNYFSRVFKKHYGLSPLQIKKDINTKTP